MDGGEEKGVLRQSYVSMIQQLPRDTGGLDGIAGMTVGLRRGRAYRIKVQCEPIT